MNDVIYPGKDLEAMTFAENYHRWILDEFREFLGRDVIEVGAGSGEFSRLLLGENLSSLTLVEPSEMFVHLSDIKPGKTKLALVQNTFAGIASGDGSTPIADTLVYVNVLEHIEDDAGELRLMHQSLTRGGKALIFVPAFQQLYGAFDRQVGHFRRYTKGELRIKAESAGFRILKLKYFDFVGILPWYVKYKILRSDSLGGGSVRLYDKLAVPVNRFLESIVTPPLGKNLLLVAEKA